MIAELLKKTREEHGFSQTDMALNVGVTQSTWSKYENGKVHIPHDIANSAIKTLRSKRIKAVYAYEMKNEFFNVPLLNNVDDNPIVVIDSLIEESTELIESCHHLKKIIKNRISREELTPKQLKQFENCQEQIADIYPALKLHFLNMYEHFNLDMDLLEKKVYQKLSEKKYIVR